MPNASLDELFTFGQIELSPALTVEQRLRAEEAMLRQRFEKHAALILSASTPADRMRGLAEYGRCASVWYGASIAAHMVEVMQRYISRELARQSKA